MFLWPSAVTRQRDDAQVLVDTLWQDLSRPVDREMEFPRGIRYCDLAKRSRTESRADFEDSEGVTDGKRPATLRTGKNEAASTSVVADARKVGMSKKMTRQE